MFKHESEINLTVVFPTGVSGQITHTFLGKVVNDFETACFGEFDYSTCIIIACSVALIFVIIIPSFPIGPSCCLVQAILTCRRMIISASSKHGPVIVPMLCVPILNLVCLVLDLNSLGSYALQLVELVHFSY